MRVRRRTDRYVMSRSPLFNLRGMNEAARALSISPSEMERLRTSHPRYREWDEEKPSGGHRHIENPPDDLKKVQGRLTKLLMRVVPDEYLFCPVAKLGAVECAQMHYGAKQIWSLDIKDYFPNTSREKVFQFFRVQLQCAGDIAGALTDLVCFNGHLPQGAPSSPILAYFANRLAWSQIEELCNQMGCRMTLWIDDLTISGDRIPREFRWKVQSILRRARLTYHKEKFSHCRKLKTTGVMVAERSFELPNSYFKGVRELRRKVRSSPIEERAELRASLAGKLLYGRYVRRAFSDMW